MKTIQVNFQSGECAECIPIRYGNTHTQVMTLSDSLKYGPTSFQAQHSEWINNRYIKGLDETTKVAN